ncbi:hypothetical protein EAE92_13615 [Photorhabdus hainanensis]|nr:hypothetical protein [Photorhabdus hainanensis]
MKVLGIAKEGRKLISNIPDKESEQGINLSDYMSDTGYKNGDYPLYAFFSYRKFGKNLPRIRGRCIWLSLYFARMDIQ